jgi:hypothetical protein
LPRAARAGNLLELPHRGNAEGYHALVVPSLGDITDPKLKRREFVSEFGVGFPHDKHIDRGGNDRAWLARRVIRECALSGQTGRTTKELSGLSRDLSSPGQIKRGVPGETAEGYRR